MIGAIAFELSPRETAIFIKRRHLSGIAPLRRFANYKYPVPLCGCTPGYLFPSVTRSFLDPPSSPTILARPQLPRSC
jgi:hypothetical protein